MSYEDYPEQDLEDEQAGSLATQLGSSAKKLSEGLIDMRILTVLDDRKNLPNTMKNTLYWLVYKDIVHDNKNFAESVIDNLLHLNVAVRGRGRRDLLRAEAVRKGTDIDVKSEIQKPGWIQRNVTRRNWEEEEREKLGI